MRQIYTKPPSHVESAIDDTTPRSHWLAKIDLVNACYRSYRLDETVELRKVLKVRDVGFGWLRSAWSLALTLALVTGATVASVAPVAHALPVVNGKVAALATLSPPDPGAEPPLQAAPGEFFSVPLYRVLDTRNGTGETGGEAQIPAGSPLNVAVTGVDNVPSDATSVVVNVVALNATASGYLTTYDTDNGDSNVASVGVKAGINANQTDTIPVSSTGTVSVANHTSAPLDVVMTLMGYYSGGSESAAGDTYFDAPWDKIVDTTTGLGAPRQQIAAGGSLTIQVGGEGGIATGADTAVIQLSAPNATTNGYLDAYAAGTSDPGVSELIYDGAMTYSDLVYVPLSSSGQVIITNHGTAPVDLVVVTRGYFMPPATTPVGAEYAPVGPDGPVYVCGSTSAWVQIAAWGTTTFQVAGTAGLPAAGVVEAAEHVIVTNPAQSGFLDVYRGGGTDPDNATMSFVANDGLDVGYQDSVLSSISPSGEETIKNHSSGTVDVKVAVVGLFFDPQLPPVPTYLEAADTYSVSPILSGIVQDSTGDDLTGEISLFDSSGNPIGGSPTATGEAATGESVTWTVPPGVLTNGDTYQWYMQACDQGVCSAPSPTQTFTVDTADAPPPLTATNTATVTGSAVTGIDAITDPGACSGSDCATTVATTLNAGYNGSNNWASGLKINLSSIPAGSTIVSATLQLTESGCLTGTGCASSAINVYPAGSDIGSAGTGPQLAAAAIQNPYTATSPATQGTWDITNIVDGWESGSIANNGIVIQAPSAGTEGIAYYSPSANVGSSGLPQVTIGYIPPAVPGTPNNLTVTPGDGGALVNWSDPSWNYDDDTGTSTATFTVTAYNSQGSAVSTQTTTGYSAVITGLTDGSSYTFAVSATNPVGTGPPATSQAVTPVAVPGGPAQYITAASQYLNAQDALDSGQAPTAAAALSGDSMEASDITEVSNEDLSLSPMAVEAAANAEEISDDTTALTNSLAMLSSDGSTVTVYATAAETYTITDTSSGSTQTSPGGGTNDYLISFSNPGSSPILTGAVDASAALSQVGAGTSQNAWSPVLDASTISFLEQSSPAPLATDAFGNFISGSDTVNGGGPGLAGAVSWALAHVCKGDTCNNDYRDDCTDFVSRALHVGGTFPYVEAQHLDSLDLDQWYERPDRANTTGTWATALLFADFQWRYSGGNGWYKYEKKSQSTTGIPAGTLVFASSKTGNAGWIDIYHMGIVTKVLGRNLIITQHSRNITEPLWRMGRTPGWFNLNVKAVWAVVPGAYSFVDNSPDCDDYQTCQPGTP